MKINEILVEHGASKGVALTRTSFQISTELWERFHKLYPNANVSATLRQTLIALVEQAESAKREKRASKTDGESPTE